MTTRDDDKPFSRRDTAPSVHAQRSAPRDPKATLQPGSDSGRVFAKPAATLADLDERQAMRMVDLSNTLRNDLAERDRKFDEKLERHRVEVDQRIIEIAAQRPPTVPPASPTAPLLNPANPNDVLIAMPATRAPSMTGDPAIDAERLRAAEQSDSMRLRSLTEVTGEQNKILSRVESAIKAQPVAAKEVAKEVAEVAAATSKEQTTAIERLLKDRNFTNLIYTLVALFVSSAVGVIANRISTKDVVHTETKEVVKDAAKPTVIIVKDTAPAASGEPKETTP